MEKYLIDLVKENNRVIIPGFGAFIISKANGYSVLFNSFLSFNDGMLIDLVAVKEGISVAEATEKVSQFVDSVKKAIEVEGKYTLEGLGTFSKDDGGATKFQQALDLNAEVSEEVSEEKSEAGLLDINSTDEVDKVIDEKPLVNSEVDENLLQIDKPIEEEHEFEGITNLYQDNSNGNRKVIVIVIAVVLAIALGVAAYFLFFAKDNEAARKKEMVKIQKAEADSLRRADSIKVARELVLEAERIEAERLEAERAAQEAKKAMQGKKYCLIIGSFKEPANATRLVDKLHSQGFKGAEIIDKGNVQMVSIESFDKFRAAEMGQEKILNSHRYESWVMKRK